MRPGDWARAQTIPFFGVEKNSDLHLVALVRLLLAGVRPALELGDALERDAAGRHHDQGFDCVLADPPWGLRVEGADLYDFPVKSKTAETLFIQHSVRFARPEGRAVIAVPPSILFRGGPDRDVRRLLMDDFRLEAVVQLPSNSRAAQTSIAPTLLLVRRAAPRDVVRLAVVKALPESDDSCRRLVDSLMAGRSDAELVVRSVGLSEIAGNDYVLEVGRYAERETDAGLEDIARLVPLKPLGEIAEFVSGIGLAREFMERGHRLLMRCRLCACPTSPTKDRCSSVRGTCLPEDSSVRRTPSSSDVAMSCSRSTPRLDAHTTCESSSRTGTSLPENTPPALSSPKECSYSAARRSWTRGFSTRFSGPRQCRLA